MGFFSTEALKRAKNKQKKARAHTILIADDEEHNLVTLADLLSDDYEVLTAKNGRQALELIRDDPNPERIHLIISDQRMPELTGVEFFRETLHIIPRAKRILLTGFTDVDAIIDSINKGQIYKFVLKPFDHRDMLMTVERALELYDLEGKNLALVEELKALNLGLEKKVQERTQELEEAMAELKLLNASKDKFFSIIAHDLRGPFHTFLLSLETLVEDLQFLRPEEIQRLASNMYQSANNLYKLLENLLNWARFQMGKMEFRPELCLLDDLVDQTVELLLENAQQKDITVENTITDQTELYVDTNMFKTVLRNLLTNAIKFTPSGGHIRLHQKTNAQGTRIHVEDSGVGISPDRLHTLFRIDTQSTTRGTAREIGTGLGLILCKELIENNGGSIHVESEFGKGSTFSFQLPNKETLEALIAQPPPTQIP